MEFGVYRRAGHKACGKFGNTGIMPDHHHRIAVSAAQQAERLRQRLDKARERYDQARSSGNDQVEAFAAAVSKLEQQLQRLAAAPTVQPGGAAATNTPATAEQPIAQLEQRLLAARTILARALAEDSPERAACQLAVDSLERELQEARPHPDG